MTTHLFKSIEQLKKKLLSLSTIVEETVHRAVQATLSKDTELASLVIEQDDIIDQEEVEVEEECCKILALYQPVAKDLRFIITVLKINNDLERIGDQAVNIANRAVQLSKLSDHQLSFDLEQMTTKTKAMLRLSLESLIELDTEKAQSVRNADNEVDDMNREMYKLAHKEILRDPQQTRKMFYYVSVTRNLERIADLATNIAEDVIYMIDGKIVRHHHDHTRFEV